MTNRCETKAIAGNSASCLGFPIALPTGSNPAASTTPVNTVRPWGAVTALTGVEESGSVQAG